MPEGISRVQEDFAVRTMTTIVATAILFVRCLSCDMETTKHKTHTRRSGITENKNWSHLKFAFDSRAFVRQISDMSVQSLRRVRWHIFLQLFVGYLLTVPGASRNILISKQRGKNEPSNKKRAPNGLSRKMPAKHQGTKNLPTKGP